MSTAAILNSYQSLVKTKLPEEVQGAIGTEILGGVITNEDFNSDFDDSEASPKIFDEMIDTEPTITQFLTAVKTPILRAKAAIIPASDDNIDRQIADEVSSNLFENRHFTYRDWLEDVMEYLDYGFVVRSKEFEIVNDRWRWKAFHYRKPHTIQAWHTDEDNNLDSITQQAFNAKKQTWETVELENAQDTIFHIAHKQKGLNFRGKSLIRPAYKVFLLKRTTTSKMGQQAEIAALGVRRIKFLKKINSSSQEYTDAIEVAENYRGDSRSFIINTPDFEMDIISGKDLIGFDLLPYAKYYDQQMTSISLAKFLEQGQASVGSHAMQSSNIELFLNSDEAIANFIEGIMNNGHRGMRNLMQLVDMNYGELTKSKDFKYPKYAIAEISGNDIEAIARVMKLFNEIGLPVFAEDYAYLREQAALPTRAVDEIKEAMEARQKEKADTAKRFEKNGNGKEEVNEDGEPVEDDKASFFMQARRGKNVTPEFLEFELRILNVTLIDATVKTAQEEMEIETRRFRTGIVNNLLNAGINILSKNKRTPDIKKVHEQLDKVVVPNKSKLITAATVVAKELFQFGREQAAEEIQKLKDGMTMQIIDDAGQALISIRPSVVAEVDGFLSKLLSEFKLGVVGQATAGTVNDALLLDTINRVSQNNFNKAMNGVANKSFGLGRGVEQKKQGVTRIVRSEVLDSSTCGPCFDIDGQEFDTDSAEFAAISAGGFTECEGTSAQCRGVNMAIAL